MVVYSITQTYLEQEEAAATKSELIRGEIVAMAGATISHARISMDIDNSLSM
ncbi:MAG: hypothetical protein NT023_00190 [Armatimonadetes bacterium]|nr:hypothetical protein [Armatimonadota bacterium]